MVYRLKVVLALLAMLCAAAAAQQEQQLPPLDTTGAGGGGAAAAAAAAAISCYASVPRREGDPPQVAAQTYEAAAGPDDNVGGVGGGGGGPPMLCAKYEFRCSAGDEGCSAAEALGGVWKWTYTALDGDSCLQLADAAARPDAVYRNVHCCSAAGCNVPDPQRDADTLVAGPGGVRGTAARVSGAAMVAAARADGGDGLLTCYVSQRPSNGPPPQQQQQQQQEQTARPVRFARGVGRGAAEVCASWQVRSNGDGDGVGFRWAYGGMSAANCAAIAELAAEPRSRYKAVACCMKSGCNRPDASVDATTRVVA